MQYPKPYPKIPHMDKILKRLKEYAQLKHEYGAHITEIEGALKDAYSSVNKSLERLLALPEDPDLAAKEPDTLEGIHRFRPKAARILWGEFNRDIYEDRLAGAFIGRLAGCTLGAPVEFWTTDAMRDWAEYTGDTFPPVKYWSSIKNPNEKRYGISTFYDYTLPGMKGVPVDDDITYTILGLLIAENYGLDFTTEDLGQGWVKYLPYACTAEEIALKNLTAGMPADTVAEYDNPYVQWIGADIRSDPWGYLAPGQPEKAARMAYRDARLSHRRNGVYGEMYFSAVIAASFALGDPIEALHFGLNEIPAECRLAEDIRWALEKGKGIRNHIEARNAVKERFTGMDRHHTNLNACLTVFGLMIGGDDFTRCIGETVVMGYDNDCTAATAASIFGAARGIGSIPEHWYKPFENKVLTYINGHPEFLIDNVLQRFMSLAEKSFG